MRIQKVKVTRNFQITIPKVIAEEIGLKVGDSVFVIYENGEIKIIPEERELKDLKGIIKSFKIISEDIDNIIRNSSIEIAKKIEEEYK